METHEEIGHAIVLTAEADALDLRTVVEDAAVALVHQKNIIHVDGSVHCTGMFHRQVCKTCFCCDNEVILTKII